MKKSFRIIGLLILIVGAFGIGMMAMSSQKAEEQKYKSPEQLKLELKQKENKFPTSYLEADATMENKLKKGGLFKKRKIDGQIIKGTIRNSATIAIFKDAVVELIFYSKTNTQISRKRYTIYERFLPNNSKDFKFEIDAPKATDSFSISVVDASPIR